ncbi:MAG: hypothetical protein AAGH15_24475 [Myxococcota bacterium]
MGCSTPVWDHGFVPLGVASTEADLPVPLPGHAIALRRSPDRSRVALLLGDGIEAPTLAVLSLRSGDTRTLLRSLRLRADFGGYGLAWVGNEALVVALASAPSEGRGAELVRTPIERWAPETLHEPPHEVAMMSADGAGRVVFAEMRLQSDTLRLVRGADGFTGPMSISRSARDDRPTSWTGTHGLLGMLRVGATHEAVRFPVSGGHPEPLDLGSWSTWPLGTDAGVLAFHPSEHRDEVDLVLHEASGPRTLYSLPEPLQAAGKGRSVPRSWSYSCNLDARCALVGGVGQVALWSFKGRTGERRHVAELPDAALRLHDVAMDGRGERAAIASVGVFMVVDLASGEVTQRHVHGAGGVFQYVAEDPRGGWFVSGIWPKAPRHRVVHVDDAGMRTVHVDRDAWIAHPVPSPDGSELAFSQMRFHSDLFRLEWL